MGTVFAALLYAMFAAGIIGSAGMITPDTASGLAVWPLWEKDARDPWPRRRRHGLSPHLAGDKERAGARSQVCPAVRRGHSSCFRCLRLCCADLIIFWWSSASLAAHFSAFNISSSFPSAAAHSRCRRSGNYSSTALRSSSSPPQFTPSIPL